MEVGKGGTKAAIDEISDRYGFPTSAIVDMTEVTDALYNHEVDGRVVIDDKIKLALDRYYARYGVE